PGTEPARGPSGPPTPTWRESGSRPDHRPAGHRDRGAHAGDHAQGPLGGAVRGRADQDLAVPDPEGRRRGVRALSLHLHTRGLTMIALLLAVALPWVEMSGGPVLLRESGRAGLGTGPMVRVEVGFPVAERLAAEAWLSGAMESAPLSAPGDRALLGAGVGGRALLLDVGQLGVWAHVGAGW